MKNLFLFTIFILASVYSYGQVKIGDNHETIDANSLLELESTDKGLLFPRLALTATDNVAPLAAHVEGMVVYNTATAGSGATGVSPGMYYNTGTAWEKINSASSTLPGAPIGSVVTMAADVVPNGYLYCDGSAVSRTTYADLFAVVSTLYGAGDGSTTFNLPDYRGYFLRGQDDGRALDPDAAARTGGDAVGSTQTDEFKIHRHGTGTVGDYNNGNGSYYDLNGKRGYHSGTTTTTNQVATTLDGGSETRPVNISVRYCIKFQETEYTGAAGPTGTAGASGSDGSSILNGTVDPTSEGADGDFYINTATNYIFGPKASGTWPTGVNMLGTDANPVGTLLTKMSSNAPTGYLYCDGSAISRTTYPSLFSDIGTTYGVGDGSTTFNLPDLRGEFLRGQDDGRGADPDAATRTNGDVVGSSQTDELKAHDHNLSYRSYTYSNGGGTIHAVNNGETGTVATYSTGGTETRPRNIAVRYYIKF